MSKSQAAAMAHGGSQVCFRLQCVVAQERRVEQSCARTRVQKESAEGWMKTRGNLHLHTATCGHKGENSDVVPPAPLSRQTPLNRRKSAAPEMLLGVNDDDKEKENLRSQNADTPTAGEKESENEDAKCEEMSTDFPATTLQRRVRRSHPSRRCSTGLPRAHASILSLPSISLSICSLSPSLLHYPMVPSPRPAPAHDKI